MPREKSSISIIDSFAKGDQKDGQPQFDSNFSFEVNNFASHPLQ
jgi:hypothetical protein